jgi:hypothetical protein
MLKLKQTLPDGVTIFQTKGADSDKILQEACAIEKKSFPKHMSMTECLEREARKPRAALLLARERDALELAGFALVTWNGSTGSITKLVVRERSRRQGYGEKLMQVSTHSITYPYRDTEAAAPGGRRSASQHGSRTSVAACWRGARTGHGPLRKGLLLPEFTLMHHLTT